MIHTKKLKEDIKCGNVELFEILENFDRTATINFTLRNHLFGYRLGREFPNLTSAFNYLVRLLDKPVIEGLSPEFKAVPPITVHKTQRRSQNETNQSE